MKRGRALRFSSASAGNRPARRVLVAVSAALAFAVGCGQTSTVIGVGGVGGVVGAPEQTPIGRAGSETNAHEESERSARLPVFDEWKTTTFGSYLAPKRGFPDGNVDLVFHFHAGVAADKDWRDYAPPSAVIVAGTWGVTTAHYANAFKDPKRFDRMIDEVMTKLRESTGNPALKTRRVSLFAWSAGFASVGRILGQGYYDRIDSVVLLDGLHASYMDHVPPGAVEHGRPFRKRVAVEMLQTYIRLAKDAVLGKKEFVFTHSSIQPGYYASTTECADELIKAVGAQKVEDRAEQGVEGPGGIRRTYHADLGDFHVRGYTGETRSAHVAQIHLLGDAFREFVIPRWNKLDEQVTNKAVAAAAEPGGGTVRAAP
jgi:hypothetical protein